MSENEITPSALSDVSANLFAAFFLVLLALLAVAGEWTQDETSLSAGAAAYQSRRMALRSDQMIEMLRARSRQSIGLSIDVFDDRIEIVSRKATSTATSAEAVARELESIVGGAGGSFDIRLYVFGHGAYRAVAQELSRRGWSWREISAPRALRENAHGGWSRAFAHLIERFPPSAEFKAELTRLLSEGGSDARQDRWSSFSEASRVAQGIEQGFAAAFADFARALRIAAGLTALAGCLALVAWIERRDSGRRGS